MFTSVYICLSLIICLAPPYPDRENFERLWSDTTNWPENTLPTANSDVVIERSWRMKMDNEPPPMGRLTIRGELFFDPQKAANVLQVRTLGAVVWTLGAVVWKSSSSTRRRPPPCCRRTLGAIVWMLRVIEWTLGTTVWMLGAMVWRSSSSTHKRRPPCCRCLTDRDAAAADPSELEPYTHNRLHFTGPPANSG